MTDNLLPDNPGVPIQVMRGGGRSRSRIVQKGGYTPQEIQILRKYHMGDGQELEEPIDEPTKQAFLTQHKQCMKNSGTKTVLNKNCWAVSRVLRELLLRDIRAENSKTDVIRVHVKPQQSVAIHVIADDVEYEELEDDDESPGGVNKGVGTGNDDSNADSTGSSESNSNSNTVSIASSEDSSESNSNTNTASIASSDDSSESNSNSNTASIASSESNSNSNTASIASSESNSNSNTASIASSESNSNSNASSVGSSTPLVAPVASAASATTPTASSTQPVIVPNPLQATASVPAASATTPTASSTQPTIVPNPLQAVAAAASVPAASATTPTASSTQPVIVPNPLQTVAAATASVPPAASVAAPTPAATQSTIVPNPLQAVKSSSKPSIPPPPVPSPAVVVKNPLRNVTPKNKKPASNNTKRAGKNNQQRNQTRKIVKNPLVNLGVIKPRPAAPAGKQNTSRNKIKISKPFNAKPAFTIGNPTLTNIRAEKLSRSIKAGRSKLRSQLTANPIPTNAMRNTYAKIKRAEEFSHLTGKNAINIVKRAEAKHQSKSTEKIKPNTNVRMAFNPLAVTRKKGIPGAGTGLPLNPELQKAMRSIANTEQLLTKPIRNGISEEDVNAAVAQLGVAQLGGSKTKRRTRRSSHRRRR